MTLTPRPPQKIALEKALPVLKKLGKALVVMATGLGKTIASALIVQALNKTLTQKPGLFLVHNNEILERTMKEYRLVFGEKTKSALFNGYSKEIQNCEIIFASFQTMQRNLKKFTRNQFSWMVVDEGHHAHAETFRKVIEYFKCPRLAMTATPDRMDMKDIRELFGEETVNIPVEEAIARGWLPKIEYHLVTDEGLDEDRLKQLTREIVQEGKRIGLEEINRRVFIQARDEKIAEIIEGYAESAVIFCRNITHAENFKKFLKSAETYHSGKGKEANQKVLENLRNGITRRVLAVNAFNEGIHISHVGLVVFNRSTDSETIFRQQLGRGLEPGKEKLVVLDFVGNIERIQMLKKVSDEVARWHEEFTTAEERSVEGYARDIFHVSGRGFEFTFADKVVDLMNLVEKAKIEFYPTWQEASEASLKLGISTVNEYWETYKIDRRLPASPHRFYENFPGYAQFFGRPGKFYSSWQEAGAVARKLGVRTREEYTQVRKTDLKLPSEPQRTYENYPGFVKFIGKPERYVHYETWQQAGRAAKRLAITSEHDYWIKYKKDKLLPRNPNRKYQDFPGWPKFLGKK